MNYAIQNNIDNTLDIEIEFSLSLDDGAKLRNFFFVTHNLIKKQHLRNKNKNFLQVPKRRHSYCDWPLKNVNLGK